MFIGSGGGGCSVVYCGDGGGGGSVVWCGSAVLWCSVVGIVLWCAMVWQ